MGLFINPTLNGKQVSTSPAPAQDPKGPKSFSKYNQRDWVNYFASQRQQLVPETLVPYSPTKEDYVHIKKLLTFMTPDQLGAAIPLYLRKNVDKQYKYLRYMQMHRNVEELLETIKGGFNSIDEYLSKKSFTTQPSTQTEPDPCSVNSVEEFKKKLERRKQYGPI